jgi:hypothetical protein
MLIQKKKETINVLTASISQSEAYQSETDFFVFCLYVGESCEVDRAREISQSEAYLPETDLFVFCLYVGESCEVERAREKLEIYKKN